jgi:hypothetical protein
VVSAARLAVPFTGHGIQPGAVVSVEGSFCLLVMRATYRHSRSMLSRKPDPIAGNAAQRLRLVRSEKKAHTKASIERYRCLLQR